MFRTSHDNVSINETSSYVDLGLLYGKKKETVNKIRADDGTCRIYVYFRPYVIACVPRHPLPLQTSTHSTASH